MPGLGQIYNGEMKKGVCLTTFFIFIPLIAAWVTVHLPPSFLLFGVTAATIIGLAIYVYGIVEAKKTAEKLEHLPLTKPFQNSFLYLSYWLISMVVMASVQGHIRQHYIHAYKIAGSSMEPSVLQGDYVLVDKTAYRREPVKAGDIIIHVYPNDRSKDFIRQVIALPGEMLPDGSEGKVPVGTVIVKGQGKEAIDSGTYGPVDLRDVIGKVRQVYFSKGRSGIRWNRVGKVISLDSSM